MATYIFFGCECTSVFWSFFGANGLGFFGKGNSRCTLNLFGNFESLSRQKGYRFDRGC